MKLNKSSMIRTFYWNRLKRSPLRVLANRMFSRDPGRHLAVGNAGDILTVDILERVYGLRTLHCRSSELPRVLCIGSIASMIGEGDILCGVGVKYEIRARFPFPKETVKIFGLRGPISYDEFNRCGFDVSKVKFLLDPGLMVRFMYGPNEDSGDGDRDVIFIPHWKERFEYRAPLPKGIKVVNIDCRPKNLIARIKASKLVYSSSLHGLVFAHALNRPCVPVMPKYERSLLKFEDYHAGVGLKFKRPLESIGQANFYRDSDTPADLAYQESDFSFPTLGELESFGALVRGRGGY